MTAKFSASADGSKVTIGNAAEDALQIDATAKTIAVLGTYVFKAANIKASKAGVNGSVFAHNLADTPSIGMFAGTSSPNYGTLGFYSDASYSGYALDINCGPDAAFGRRAMRLYDAGQVRFGNPGGVVGQSPSKAYGGFFGEPIGSTETVNIVAVQKGDSVLSMVAYWQAGVGQSGRIQSINATTLNADRALDINCAGFTQNGSLVTTAAGNTSDRRTKENVTDISGALDAINALRPVKFDFKPEYRYGDKTLVGKQFGVIADEINEVFPELVNDSPTTANFPDAEKLKAVNYIGLIPQLVAAIQELTARVAELEAR